MTLEIIVISKERRYTTMKDYNKDLKVLKVFTKEDLLIIFNTIMENAKSVEKAEMRDCHYCSGNIVIRYGKKHGKQRFLCKDCYKTFVTMTNTVISMSHQSIAVLDSMIEDTQSILSSYEEVFVSNIVNNCRLL